MDHLMMHQTGIAVTMACNLKCKLCSNYAPYYACPPHESREHFREMMRRYFTIVTHVRKLMITGGEPFLHPHLDEFIWEIQQYKNQLDIFGVITNGGVIPKDSLLQAAKEFGEPFHVLIDDYGPEHSPNVPAVIECLKAYDIPYIWRHYSGQDAHCGGWVDFGDLTQKKCQTQQQAEALYAKCAYPQKLHFAFDLVDGVMYPCGPSRRCQELGIAGDASEYIDLFDDTLSVEQQREKVAAIYERKTLSACFYCNGMHEDSPRFEPADQLTEEELALVRAGARLYAEVQARKV